MTTTTVVIDGAGVLRYRGQFKHGKHALARDAIEAILTGKEVRTKTTPHKG